jgi:multicomponent Na+:H+ antiporter subunit G
LNAAQGVATVLLCAGALFYLGGTIGLIRFPDALSRLHALTKADNLGLGLVCAGLAVLAGDARVAGALLVIWLLGLLAATVSCHLIARAALGAPAHPRGGAGGDDALPDDGWPHDALADDPVPPGAMRDGPAPDSTTGRAP